MEETQNIKESVKVMERDGMALDITKIVEK